MKTIAAALCLGVLCACTPLAPVIKTEGQTINVPTVQKCVDSKDIPVTPEFPLDVVDLSNEAEQVARLANAARLERKVRREYVTKVTEVLKKCSD